MLRSAKPQATRVALGLAILVGFGCGDSAGPDASVHGRSPGTSDGQATSVQVSPTSASLEEGANTPLSCLALDPRGVAVTAPHAWLISDPGVATISASGAVTGVRAGTAFATCDVAGKTATATITVTSSPVALVEVTPGAGVVVVGASMQLAATPLDSNGSVVPGYGVQWSSADSTIATVSGTGAVVARAAGTASILASSGGKASLAKINVATKTPAPVGSVSIVLNDSTLNAGQLAHATATTIDINGQVVSGRSITWSVDDPSVISAVSTSGDKANVTGRHQGTTTLRATCEGKSASVPVVVATSPVQTVTVVLAATTIFPGQTTQANATLTDALGNVLTGRTVTWASLDQSIATVSAVGVVTGISTGAVIIRATSEGKTGDGTETVGVAPVATVSVSLANPNLAPGQTTQATAVPKDASGTPLTGRSVSWASLSPSIATVSVTGAVTAVAAGSATIRATVESKTGDAALTVGTTAAPVSPKVARVSVQLSKSSLVVGDSTQATAAAFDSTGAAVTNVSVSWSTASTTLAQVDGTGKVKSMATGSTAVVATVNGVTGNAGLTITSAPALATPVSGTAAQVLAVVGPTVAVAQVPSAFSSYESRFKFYIDSQWNVFGPRWDAGNSISGYERAAIYYTWWARTGDTTYLSRAHATAVNYRDNYLIPAGYATSPHWSQMESLYLDWLVTGDAASRDAVVQVANKFVAFDPYLDKLTTDWLENRVQTRVMMSWWMAEKIQGKGSQWTAYLDEAIPRVLAMQNADGSFTFPIATCNGSLNYMSGMLADFLTRVYDQRGASYNPQILAAMTKLGNYLWSTQWRGTATPTDKSFNYVSLLCMGTGRPTSAPDLNGLMLPLFGWLGQKTGDATWFTRGDQILAGMAGADLELYRQFSESYSSSFRYFGYRP
jgi:hypothetical protein